MEVTKVVNATRIFKVGEVETRALRGVDLVINNGEFTALVGPSGSGKTALLQLIGLLDQPTTGSIYINGREATSLNRDKRADLRKGSIGFIYQFFALIPQAAADVIATLNPKPGFMVSSEDPKYVVPDLLVERVDEEYVVLLNDRHLPRLRVAAAYEGVLREKKKSECTDGEVKTREYIQGKLNSARWLIQTIEQRRRTMIKVMNCIIREQREFFEKGIAFLRPLTLQQVARQIDMHESTVSRVCSGKYVQCPRGVFELKFFFSSGLETEDGEDVSARSAKEIIKTLIDEEDRRDPLSDQRIAELLHERGLRIARRTVGKYREQLSILPARFRRRVA